MTTTNTIDQHLEIRTLNTAEVDSVAGGLFSSVDVSGMPDRMEGGCGTMWWQRKLITIFTGGRL